MVKGVNNDGQLEASPTPAPKLSNMTSVGPFFTCHDYFHSSSFLFSRLIVFIVLNSITTILFDSCNLVQQI